MASNDKKFIVSYKNELYNIGGFVARHPGGKVIDDYENKDITEAFDSIGHSAGALRLLQKYAIAPEEKQKDGPTTLDKKRQATQFVVKKLFTKEDNFNMHKTLGFLSLASFAYRYFYVLPTTGTLGFEVNNALNYATLALHMLLSCSSIIFHVLRFRIEINPLIIYEEYRLHAMVFTLRAIGVSVYGMYIHLIPEHLRKIGLCAFMVGAHLLVDYITVVFGKAGVTAVRNTNDGTLKGLRTFFSYYQFTAIGAHLVLDTHLCDLGFNAVIAIQSSAFLMTLKRKSLIRWKTYALWYGLALVASMGYMLVAKGPLFFLAIYLVFLVRTKFNVNKYVLWASYALIFYNFEALVTAGADVVTLATGVQFPLLQIAGIDLRAAALNLVTH